MTEPPPSSCHALLRRQAVRRVQQGGLVGIGGGHLASYLPFVQHQHTVTDQLDLRQLAGKEEDAGALGGELAKKGMDLPFGPYVDPAGRVEEEQYLEAGGEPASDRHLLLVAAAQPPYLPLRANI